VTHEQISLKILKENLFYLPNSSYLFEFENEFKKNYKENKLIWITYQKFMKFYSNVIEIIFF